MRKERLTESPVDGLLSCFENGFDRECTADLRFRCFPRQNFRLNCSGPAPVRGFISLGDASTNGPPLRFLAAYF